MEIGVAIENYLQQKGFDSSSGGKPSPILPDGRMVSLPILTSSRQFAMGIFAGTNTILARSCLI
ncbi:MAG: hypothetical protein IPH23_05180 [Gammaproteobacteria bacterium]|nr:hypothetical protein [Gammaproteobacteria bacterium]